MSNVNFKSFRTHCINPSLKKYIKQFWEVEAYSEKEISNLLLPVTNNDIIIYLSEPLTYKFNSGDVSVYTPVFQGPRTKSINVSQKGSIHIIGVTFNTFFSGAFVDSPLKELIDRVKILKNVKLNKKINSLKEDQVYFEKTLRDIIDSSKIPSSEQTTIMEEVLNYPGKLSEYSSENNINIKKIERLYLKYTGLNPKKFIKIYRMQQTNNKIIDDKIKSLTELSYDMGYFDQTHMGKDFTSIHSKKPGDFLNDNFSLKSILKKNQNNS